MQKKVFIKTFGCQMNEHDSQAMLVMLQKDGYTLVGTPEEADLVLFNTCTIREKAYHKAMSELGRTFQRKKLKTDVKIGVTGCAAQQGKENIIERFKHVDFVLGPDDLARLPVVAALPKGSKPVVATELINSREDYEFLDVVPPQQVQGASAFVSIMKGCNCQCSYCIVPSVRGREVCRSGSEIVDQVQRLVEKGVKEVMLLGQNVASYRDPLYGDHLVLPVAGTGNQPRSLAQLIRLLVKETQIERLRFISPHPRDFEDTLIAAFRDIPQLCSAVHLPAQSGNNNVLKRMRRGYTREHYLNIVQQLRAARPGIAISTDIIVGFPGETDAEFAESVSLVQEVGHDGLYAFTYSERPGTFAESDLADDVPESVKEERLKILLDAHREVAAQKNQQCVGNVAKVLVTGADKAGKHSLSGRGEDNRNVHFDGPYSLVGQVVPVKITSALGFSLEGQIC